MKVDEGVRGSYVGPGNQETERDKGNANRPFQGPNIYQGSAIDGLNSNRQSQVPRVSSPINNNRSTVNANATGTFNTGPIHQ